MRYVQLAKIASRVKQEIEQHSAASLLTTNNPMHTVPRAHAFQILSGALRQTGNLKNHVANRAQYFLAKRPKAELTESAG